MKFSTQIAAAVLAFLPVLNTPQLLAAPSNATPQTRPKVPLIARDNFVSLSWRTSFFPKVVLTVKGNLLSLKDESSPFGNAPGGYSGPAYSAPRPSNNNEITVGLSNNQLASLVDQLNKSHVGEIAKQDRDAPQTSFTLVWSDKNNADQSLQFNSYDSAKPGSGAVLAVFLRDLVKMKIPELEARTSITPTIHG